MKDWKDKLKDQVTYKIDFRSKYGNYSSFEKTFNDNKHFENWWNYMHKQGHKIIGETQIK